MTTTTTSIDRAAINRRNAQKSTGPRTPEGKSRSRFNALKHGMTAKTLVLPDEDADVLQMRIETWIADLQPQNDVEQYLVEHAVQFSWKLERADRAEVAQLSRIIESVPIAEANRQQEVVSALGYWLLSDRNAGGDIAFRDDLLNVLVPAQPGPPDHRCLDIRNHPEAIVFRLESTAAGCQWLLDRWTELRALLDQGRPWFFDEKVKAIRLLGKRPVDLEPSRWQDYLENQADCEDPKLDELIEGQLDRQLDPRFAQVEEQPEPLAAFRGVVERAISRLEVLAAGHRARDEADAAQQAALLSFDASTNGERLRRYQFSCSRSLFRSLETLIKVRRSGVGVASEERTDGSEEGLPSAVESESVVDRVPTLPRGEGVPVRSGGPTPAATPSVETGRSHAGGWEPGFQAELDPAAEASRIVERPTETEPTPATSDPGNLPNEPTDPPVDRGNPQNEPTDPRVAAISGPRLPFHRAVVSAMILVVLFGAAVGSHRHSQNEPRAVTIDHRNRQNEATAAPRWVAGDSPTASASIPATRRGGGLLVSSSDAPMTVAASPSAVSRILTEPSVFQATLYRYQEIDSIERSARPPRNLCDVRATSGIPDSR
jgi:hypothetical protein